MMESYLTSISRICKNAAGQILRTDEITLFAARYGAESAANLTSDIQPPCMIQRSSGTSVVFDTSISDRVVDVIVEVLDPNATLTFSRNSDGVIEFITAASIAGRADLTGFAQIGDTV